MCIILHIFPVASAGYFSHIYLLLFLNIKNEGLKIHSWVLQPSVEVVMLVDSDLVTYCKWTLCAYGRFWNKANALYYLKFLWYFKRWYNK